MLGWIVLDGTWAQWLAHPITVAVFSVLAVGELVTDQLPKTPSRKTAMQFIPRLVSGGFAGAVIGTAWGYTFGGLGAGSSGPSSARREATRPAGVWSPPTAVATYRSRYSRTWSPWSADSPSHGSPRWCEMDTEPTTFDAIIIGAGQAGPPLAGRLTEAGQTVAVIERKLVGGTCVNYGCIPTKTLVASAHAAHLARRAPNTVSAPVT